MVGDSSGLWSDAVVAMIARFRAVEALIFRREASDASK
jgi:hypothetical protein